MARRLPQTPFDYLVIGASPALIMLLVGSLVFFLAEVLYSGDYKLRLCFILAMFVMAIVCVARISMEEGAGYAALFGAPLGLVTFLAMISFVQFSGVLGYFGWAIDLFFIGLVWWSAHKLTWDCTLIDESQDASGQGLMQTIGFDGEEPAQNKPQVKLPLWERWFGEGKKGPHAPGVWVVYFSLAALPIFGIGQWFIPSADLAARRYTFWLLVIYVASGLALLVTTSLLGLRRYLRQRQLAMPEEMAAVWAAVGGVMIVVLLAFCFFLPRPRAEYAVSHLPFEITTPVKWPSRWGFGNDGPQDNKLGTRTGPQSQTGGQGEGKGSENKVQGSGEKGAEDSKGSNGSSGKTENQGDNSQGGSSSSGQDGSGSKQPDKSEQQGSSGSGGSSKRSGRQGSKEPNNNGAGGKRPEENQRSGSNGSRSSASTSASQQTSKSQPPPPTTSQPQSQSSSFSFAAVLSWLGWFFASVLKLLFYGVLAAVAVYLGWRYRKELAAAFQKFIEEMWALWMRLFGKKTKAASPEDAAPAKPVYRRFADYANPFTSGLAARLSPAELVRYTFEAVEAWGRDHNCPREPHQTPHEYAEQLARKQAGLARDAGILAELYCRAAYAAGTLPPAAVPQMQQVWNVLGASV